MKVLSSQHSGPLERSRGAAVAPRGAAFAEDVDDVVTDLAKPYA